MKRWVQWMKKTDFNATAEKFNISPVLARLLTNRDVVKDEDINMYLNGTIDDLYDGMLIKDMDKAIEVLKEKIENEKSIRIIGDYDIDGVNATYILQKGIEGLGGKVSTDIPDRVKDGYGLNIHLVDKAIKDGMDTIITCDNGIAAYDEIMYAKDNGITVIVTDHHEVPFEEEDGEIKTILPPADAVVDIKRPDCEYPFKGLCGAAVAYKLIEALYEVMGADSEKMHYLIENAAIATVGDVMELEGENRIIVKEGLKRLDNTSNIGLQALMKATEKGDKPATPYYIGFVLGPCINASGRLDTAKKALNLLNAKTEAGAEVLANELKKLNDDRKDMTEKGVEQAVEMIEGTSMKNDRVLVVYLPHCHESIAGIIAGRIREKYYKPTFVLTKAEEGVKGSARSIEKYDMFKEMNKCKELFTKFGGHKLAAGLSLEEENVDIFRKRINELCELTEDDLDERIHFDMVFPFGHINENLIEEFKRLEPCGNGNPKAIFAMKDIHVSNVRVVGKNRNVAKALLTDPYGSTIEGIYFGEADEFYIDVNNKNVDLMFYFDINKYNGNVTLQAVIKDYAKV